MKRILIPTDYSETANNAFKYALHLADRKDAELYVLHVYDPPVISGHITPTLVDGVYEKYNFDELEHIESQAPILQEMRKQQNADHIKIFLKVKAGLLIPEILSAIEDNKIDFIVMGTDGGEGFRNKILGTNTLNTIDKVSVPVLSVPKEANFKMVENIIFLTAYDDDEEASLAALVEDNRNRDVSIKCVHLKQSDSSNFAKNYSRWKAMFMDDKVDFHVFSSAKSVYKAILSFIEEESVDVVGIVHRPRHFFEKFFSNSLTVHLARKLKVPLLVYRKEARATI